jgi:uncharacterized SAM-binding protein YcdF (DUF218 family)
MKDQLRGCLFGAMAQLFGLTLIALILVVGGGRFLFTSDSLSRVDAIVVLGGEGGGFQRTQHALDLLEAGYAPTVVFSGGTLADAGIVCSSAQLSLEAAEQMGFPRDAAVIAEGAQSTYDEALNLRRLAEERDWHSLIIVTDAFHTRRTGRTFRTLLPDTTIYVSAAPDPRYDPVRWWRTESGLISVFNELVKLGYYWFRYGICPI